MTMQAGEPEQYQLNRFNVSLPTVRRRCRSSKCIAPDFHPATVQTLKFLEKFGAGEAIRTLDPNLGKVVLYP
jgi:hypothetical protein